jgi:hypothetical protein
MNHDLWPKGFTQWLTVRGPGLRYRKGITSDRSNLQGAITVPEIQLSGGNPSPHSGANE